MKVIQNNYIPAQKPIEPENRHTCYLCKSIVEIEESDIKRGDFFYSQREIDHYVRGFHCPCCNNFSPLK